MTETATKTRVTSAVRTLSLAALIACSATPDRPLCEGDRPPSVHVTVETPDGEPVPDVQVSYLLDDLDPGDCGAVDDPPTRFTCGNDRVGSFAVTAQGYGYPPQTEVVDVRRNGCFVTPAEIDFVLEPVECETRTSTSVTVTVVDSATSAIAGASVSYAPIAADWEEPEACKQSEPRVFLCGDDHVGLIEIVTVAPGYKTDTRQVTVRTDPCGMLPAQVTVVLFRE